MVCVTLRNFPCETRQGKTHTAFSHFINLFSAFQATDPIGWDSKRLTTQVQKIPKAAINVLGQYPEAPGAA